MIQMNPDCTAEEVLKHELDRLREEYIRNYNSSLPVEKIGQSMAKVVNALALTYIARNGGNCIS